MDDAEEDDDKKALLVDFISFCYCTLSINDIDDGMGEPYKSCKFHCPVIMTASNYNCTVYRMMDCAKYKAIKKLEGNWVYLKWTRFYRRMETFVGIIIIIG